MKDFAKSIRTGNSYTKGQVLYTRGNKKFVYGGEINGTYIVYRQPDGRTFSFSSEEGVKQFIKDIPVYESAYVGNAWTSVDEKRLNELLKKGPSKMTDEEWKEFQELNKRADQENAKALKKLGNSKVGNEYKPDIRITPADLSRNLKQAKNISEIDDIDDEIEYDLREYENAIDECKLKIKDYERSISALRMIQRDVSDARRNLK